MQFSAEILSCEGLNGKYALVLDRTAFFPEGGGQAADTGYINGIRVYDVQEKDGIILHFVEAPLDTGNCSCELDAEQRLRRMQNHSGEHIVSGLINSTFAADNVGFHMSAGFMTIDFNAELEWEQLMDIEKMANEAVRADLPVIQHFPEADELKNLKYRSKLELTENVRLVEIPGIDICACCAPHVLHTGEIGIIKIISAERHRGGVRVTLNCGMDALDTIRSSQNNITEISNLLSAKREETAEAVRHLMQERDEIKYNFVALENELVSAKADRTEKTDGNICLFEKMFSDNAQIELVNLLVEKCGGIAGVFMGSDDTGWKYVIGSTTVDLRAESKKINEAIGGKGGGKPQMIMGRASKPKSEIEAYFNLQ